MGFTHTMISAILLGTMIGLLLAGIALLSHQKKRSLHVSQLIGATAMVHTKLDPEGSILLNGEVWPARSTGQSIEVDSRVKVFGAQDHVLLVTDSGTH